MSDESVKEQAEKLLEQLELVKTEFVKNKDELAVSAELTFALKD